MISTRMTLRLLATTLILSGVAFAGAAMAKPLTDTIPAGSQKVASSVTAAGVGTAVPASVVAPVPAAVSDTAPACARKVKMIYAGYGEAARASCVVSTSASAD